MTFVMAGSDIPGLTWAYGRVPTEAGEVDGIVIDYYTQALIPGAHGKGLRYGLLWFHADAFRARRLRVNKRFSSARRRE